MGHTTPRGSYCLTVSALVFTDAVEPQVLLHRHKRYPITLQPGGHVESGEHPRPAVLRELREETGIDPDQLMALTPMKFTPAMGGFPAPVALDVHQVEPGWSHTDLIFAFAIDGLPRSAPAAGESLELGWFTAAQASAHPDVPRRIVDLVEQLTPCVVTWPRFPATAVKLDARALEDADLADPTLRALTAGEPEQSAPAQL
jgi:8-oxo-dGTP pyrophosphatase MutT (NUDIX family)